MICVGDIVSAMTHGMSEVDEDLVERRRRLMPLQLLDAISGSGFTGPQLPQRSNLRFELLQRGVEARRRGVDLLPEGAFDLIEVV